MWAEEERDRIIGNFSEQIFEIVSLQVHEHNHIHTPGDANTRHAGSTLATALKNRRHSQWKVGTHGVTETATGVTADGDAQSRPAACHLKNSKPVGKLVAGTREMSRRTKHQRSKKVEKLTKKSG
jgi:hypothetical protein